MTRDVLDLPEPIPQIIDAMEDKKAHDVVVLNLRQSGAFTDYFVVGTGGSTRQVQAIADAVGERLRAVDSRPTHVEGYDHAEWVLMDCFDVIVHVFTREARRQYDLERLWGSATRLEISPLRPSDPPGLQPS
jgi:ribosome-associated protein